MTGDPSQMSWTIVGKESFPNGLSDVQNAVVQEKVWAIITSECLGVKRSLYFQDIYQTLQSTKMLPQTLRLPLRAEMPLTMVRLLRLAMLNLHATRTDSM